MFYDMITRDSSFFFDKICDMCYYIGYLKGGIRMENNFNEKIDNNMFPNYFDVIKYIYSVEIEQGVLEHLAELQEKFDKYLKTLKKYGHNKALDYLLFSLYNELLYSNQIESDRILSPIEMLDQQILIKKR